MAASFAQNCTVLLSYESSYSYHKESDYLTALESKDEEVKIRALKSLISALVSGEHYPKLMMAVIKYCLHCQNHFIQKLLLLYWEVAEKKSREPPHALLHEMILVCNALKNNICSANEFLRGSTLRFLSKIGEVEILESLIPSVLENLTHRHSYVRKNVVLTVYAIFSQHPELIPDAPQLIETFLQNELNPAVKRNAFLMLYQCSSERAILYLDSVVNSLSGSGDAFQLVALELIRKVCRLNPTLKALYIKAIHHLVTSSSSASVSYEAANTLVALTGASIAVRAAVTAYTTLLQNESENNIKLVLLSRLAALKARNEKILQEMILEIMLTLASPNLEIRRQTLSLSLELLTLRNVSEVVQLLKKELLKVEQSAEYALSSTKGDAYKKLLIDAMHACAVKFTHVVPQVVTCLLSYLSDEQASSALDIIYFVREIVHEYPAMRANILTQVLAAFADIKSSEVYRVALWTLGEYALEPSVVQQALLVIKGAVGTLPLLQSATPVEAPQVEEKRKEEEEKKAPAVAAVAKKPAVLADGTYASQSAVASMSETSSSSSSSSSYSASLSSASASTLRNLLLNGDFFLASCLAATLSKLALRSASTQGFNSGSARAEIASVLLILSSLLRLGHSSLSSKAMDPDSQMRITLCARTLLEPEIGAQTLNESARAVFAEMLSDQRKKSAAQASLKPSSSSLASSSAASRPNANALLQLSSASTLIAQADDLIQVRQLKGKNGAEEEGILESDEADLARALGQAVPAAPSAAAPAASSATPASDLLAGAVHRVYQLTGFSDPIYAEAHLSVQSYDIVLELLLVNQTSSILQNVTMELHASGELKVVERPSPLNLAPFAAHKARATIKLSSTESAIIFGNIVYDNASGTVKSIVVLNNIHLDIEDFISPAYVSDASFRAMWAEFEWENKVAVSTEIASLPSYLAHIISITNMQCLTPLSTLQGEANFLAANLYARSMFNEDALLNVSIELQRNGKITGYLRIRSKTQGIALSLGDKLTQTQKSKLVL